MTLRSFWTRLVHAQLELTNAWLVTLAPCHFVLSIALLFKLKTESVGIMFGAWMILALIAAYCVLVNGLDPARKPIYYIVVFWFIPILGFGLFHGGKCISAQGASLDGFSAAKLLENRKEIDSGPLLVPGYRWIGDRHNVGQSLSHNSGLLVMGTLQFIASVLVHTPHVIYVMFIAGWLFQIRGLKR